MAREVLPNVHEVFFPKALVNAYIVQADVPTLIDTGTPGAAGHLVKALRGAGHEPTDVGRILITHRHADHAGNAAELARLTGAEVHVSPGDAPFVAEAREQPVPKPTSLLGRALVPYVKVALPWTLDPVEAHSSLIDGATVGPFRVVETPGHTGGHVSLLWEERGILFTADAAQNITGVAPHFAADNPQQARTTFDRLRDLDFDSACFGHGRTLRSGARQRFR